MSSFRKAWLPILIERFSAYPFFPVFSGLLAMAATLSMTIPTTSVLFFAVLFRPGEWKKIWLWASFGSALGGVMLVLAFHEFAWEQIYSAFPEFGRSRSWIRVVEWVRNYGLFALAWVAGLPLPQTPALLFCSMARLPPEGVFLAMLSGKLVKYGAFTWVVSRFPEKVRKFGAGRFGRK